MTTNTKELLTELYCNKQMTQKEMAILLGCDQGNLCRIMKRLEIPARSYSESQKLYWTSGADITKQKANLIPGAFKDHHWEPSSIAKRSALVKGIPRHAHDDNFRHKSSLSHKANPNRYWLGKKRPDISALFKTDYYAKILHQHCCKPNLIEIKLDAILGRNFPGEWKFVGDGSVILGGLCPDFININGKKLIIEVFGSYWHNRERRKLKFNQTVEGRMEAFKVFGFHTLILWDYDIEGLPEAELINRVKKLEAM